MDFKARIGQLKTEEDVKALVNILSEMADSLDVLYSTTAPNGNISGRQGQLCLYNNSGTYTLWICTTGSTVWQQIGADTSLWQVDGTETQLITADEIDMQTKKIINLAAPASDNDAARKVDVDAKAASGANSDITSLSGLTTALSAAQGGTGFIHIEKGQTGAITAGNSATITFASNFSNTNYVVLCTIIDGDDTENHSLKVHSKLVGSCKVRVNTNNVDNVDYFIIGN